MNYILSIINEIKLETHYRMRASQFDKLETYETFGEFLNDAWWYSKEMLYDIKYNAKYYY